MLKFYGYKKCSTSNKAERFLKDNQVSYTFTDIMQTTPSKSYLKLALQVDPQKKHSVFNTSGVMYREKKIKDILPNLNLSQIIDLLSSEGPLIKRPIITDGARITIGFNEISFKKNWVN